MAKINHMGLIHKGNRDHKKIHGNFRGQWVHCRFVPTILLLHESNLNTLHIRSGWIFNFLIMKRAEQLLHHKSYCTAVKQYISFFMDKGHFWSQVNRWGKPLCLVPLGDLKNPAEHRDTHGDFVAVARKLVKNKPLADSPFICVTYDHWLWCQSSTSWRKRPIK